MRLHIWWTCRVKFLYVELAPVMADREQFDSDAQVEQVFGTDGCLLTLPFVSMERIVAVRHNEESARSKIGGTGSEDLVCAEQHISDGSLASRRSEDAVRILADLSQVLESSDDISRGDVQVSVQVAVGILRGRARVAPEFGLLSAEEQDAHHVFGLGNDSLLHHETCTLQCCDNSAVVVLGPRFRGSLQHGLADLYGEEDRIFLRLVFLRKGEHGDATRRWVETGRLMLTFSPISSSPSSSSGRLSSSRL